MNQQLDLFKKRLEEITADIFFKFLDEKGASSICPICGCDDQSIAETKHIIVGPSGGTSSTFVTYFKYYPNNNTDSDTNYFYKLTCINCGFISTYSVTSVLDWIEQTKQESKEPHNGG